MDKERLIVVACHECDLLHRLKPLPTEMIAKCTRCHAVLYHRKPNSIDKTLAFSIAGLILFILTNSLPFLGIDAEGQIQETTLMTGIIELYREQRILLSMLVFITSVLIPLIQLILLLYVFLPLKLNRISPWATSAFRTIRLLQPWSMMEIFMLGILVSIVKLSSMADIIPGIALFSFALLILVFAEITSSIDPHLVWERLDEMGKSAT